MMIFTNLIDSQSSPFNISLQEKCPVDVENIPIEDLFLNEKKIKTSAQSYIPLPASKPPMYHALIYSILPLHKMGLERFTYTPYMRGVYEI